MYGMRLLRLYSLTAALLLAAMPAAAVVPLEKNRQLGQGDREHAKNAFYFAEKNNWYEAVTHASRAKAAVLRDYMTWRALQQNESGYRFDAYRQFLLRNPAWPNENRLVIYAEDRLFSGDSGTLSAAELQQWFTRYPPISGKGKLVMAEMIRKTQGESERFRTLVREAWVDGDYDITQEKTVMLRYANALRREDHIARTDRLIWQEKYTAAGRMMFALPKDYQALFEARIRLALNKPGVNNDVARVPSSLRNDPGLAFERMRWRARKGMDDGVEEILLATPKTVPHPSRWWRDRHVRVREALSAGRPAHAMKLLANHGQTEGIGLADALWLQGWISLVYMEQPAKAFEYFREMEKSVSYPVSKSRASYWMGRAATAMGQPAQAQQYYAQAAAHNTTFYGQLAAAKLQSSPRMYLPQTARPSAEQLRAFHADPRVKVVYLLAEMGKADLAYTFIGHLMKEADTAAKAVMTAELGLGIGRQDYSVQASKDAMQQHITLPQTGFPRFQLNFKPPVEEAFVWAITRQESLFNPNARSSANAQGMMQVLPGTAREVARKNDIPYQESRLYDAAYNLRIGSTYLAQMVNSFNGSYILAIAAYNAGPGRVRSWVAEYGPPGKTPEEALDWIERIPFSETRNYVQRVLENLQVYRAIVNPQGGQVIQLEKDLVR